MKNVTIITFPKRTALLSKLSVLLALLLVCIILSFLTDKFLTSSNLLNVVRQISVNGLLAIGMTLVVLTGEIDLSVGAIVGLSGVVTAKCMINGVPILLCILIGLMIGFACGVFSGFLVSVCNMPSFVATLGIQGILRGISLLISGGYPVSGLPASFTFLGKGRLANIPIPMIILFALAILMQIVLTRTAYGRNLYAIGGSRKAALYSGIAIKKNITLAFAISGLFAALGGIVLTARLSCAETMAGEGYEQLAIAAVVIGGASLMGGKGSIYGTILGAFVIGVINNGMTLLSIPSYWQQIVQGAIIILAVLLTTVDTKKKYQI